MPGLKTLAVVVAVKGGARWEPEDRSGWSHLLEHLVFKGAGGRSARQISETVESVGGDLNACRTKQFGDLLTGLGGGVGQERPGDLALLERPQGLGRTVDRTPRGHQDTIDVEEHPADCHGADSKRPPLPRNSGGPLGSVFGHDHQMDRQ